MIATKKKKVGLLKPQSIKKKLLVTTPNLKKKQLPPPEILAVVKANMNWKKHLINITIILG